ncbi:uncharacterized protein LOC134268379 [Saccostrea cucullata]|uniref:uncharacterized protein LOC134268379 n=1 Tax=Saccostrea cuccullata TaxID=36930 RepID=UPI002ED3F9E1
MTYCGGNRSCDPVTGVCHDRCIEGLNGALCNEEKPISSPPTCNSDKTSIIIGVIISVVIVVIGSAINFILWKRNQSIIAVKCDLKSSADQKDVDFTGKNIPYYLIYF